MQQWRGEARRPLRTEAPRHLGPKGRRKVAGTVLLERPIQNLGISRQEMIPLQPSAYGMRRSTPRSMGSFNDACL
jgi:hypothetical protein